MATCIEQRGRNSWRVTVSAGYQGNKQQRIRQTIKFPSSWSADRQRKEVEKKAALLFSEHYHHDNTPCRDMPFSDYALLWLKEYAEKNMELDRLKVLA